MCNPQNRSYVFRYMVKLSKYGINQKYYKDNKTWKFLENENFESW